MSSLALCFLLLLIPGSQQAAAIYPWNVQLCTAGSDAACNYLAAMSNGDFCCANITTSSTGKAATSINGCWSRDMGN